VVDAVPALLPRLGSRRMAAAGAAARLPRATGPAFGSFAHSAA